MQSLRKGSLGKLYILFYLQGKFLNNMGPFTYYYVITFCLFLDTLLPSVIKFGIG